MISIKLPNFLKNNRLIALKYQMGIAKDTYGDFGNSHHKTTRFQLETVGIEVEDSSEITHLDDHTLTYKGERVILYIRDVSDYNNSVNLPKFHVANCSTLQSMISNGRKRRYVVCQNETNIFHLNFVSGNSVRKEDHSLSVCKNCLEILGWNGYSKEWSFADKNKCVSHFKIKDFFVKYPKSLINKKEFSDKNSSLNQYTNDWNTISNRYKQFRNWVCEQCSVNLMNNRRLLHVHHINGQKNENHYSNLRALCVCCHANQHMHSHMLNQQDTSKDINDVLEIRRRQGI